VLDGAVVLVTGATGNVGWGAAQAARDAGATLMLTTRSDAGADTLAASFPGAHVVLADVAGAAGCAAVAAAVDELGRLDHVVAPIGAWWQRGATLDQEPAELDELLATYVGAQLRLVQTTAPALRRAAGSYTIVTGAAGEFQIPDAGLLVVAVRGQYALSDVLRHELRGDTFRINEFRIDARVEPVERPGVIPSLRAGEAFVAVMTGSQRSELIRFPGTPS
jgi:NAD(P)-dependent dehydrogenase (short-subunit alcohol dehydrogenase family)